MLTVAQLVEHQIVILMVVSSILIRQPKKNAKKSIKHLTFTPKSWYNGPVTMRKETMVNRYEVSMTERVGTGLQNQLGRFDSGSTLQKNLTKKLDIVV